MVLFHGTNERSASSILHDGIILSKSKDEADFGKGFYTTGDYGFAVKCAKRRAYGSVPAVLAMELDMAKAGGMMRLFQEADILWAQYIVNNRNGYDYVIGLPKGLRVHNLDADDEIVIGKIADIDVISVAESLKHSGKAVDSRILSRMVNLKYPDQISFHTEGAVRCIREIRRA